MTLIKSISGMRGTIGGKPGKGLTPVDLLELTCGYSEILKTQSSKPTIVVGRDGRTSGEAILQMICGTLRMCGCDVVNLDLSTTPTVEMAVPYHKADGGIILTASHNPQQWNALKFLNSLGEFISAETGAQLLEKVKNGSYEFPEHDLIGDLVHDHDAISRHIEAIIDLQYVDVDAIKSQKYHVAIDAINSTGAISIPPLLDKLGVSYTMINGEVSGRFNHNPEPLPHHLNDLKQIVIQEDADMGIAVDPDVDRLAFFGPSGKYFGEEYTLVAAADHVLSMRKGSVVSNLSSTKALTDLAEKHDQSHHQSAVGEVNVVNLMKESDAVIGGEGNGGVILPELHYGRDALVGIAIVLSMMAQRRIDLNQLRTTYSHYEMIKDKIPLSDSLDPDQLQSHVKDKFISSYKVSTVDGVKIFFEHGWVHLRKSNTEPIMRVYSEGRTEEEARMYIGKVTEVINLY